MIRKAKFDAYLLFFLIALLFPTFANAEPAINSVSGSFSNGASIAISGVGFGSKSPAAPTKWDNFENGTNGNTVGNNWELFEGGGSDLPKYSTAQLRTNSTMSVICDMVKGYTSEFGIHTLPSDPQTFYVTYWRYDDLPTPFPNNFNYKPMRFYGNSSVATPEAFFNEYQAQQSILGVYNDGGLSIPRYTPYVLPQYQWVREEYYLYAGTQGGSDGVFTYWVNGTQVRQCTGEFLNSASRFNYVVIGHYASSRVLKAYIDDVYIDNTLARVEIGDGSTWAACTRREVQIPSAWSTSSITITVNQGSFPSSNTAYLYVVDSNGSVNSTGYPIRIVVGGGGDKTPPSPPSGLRVLN